MRERCGLLSRGLRSVAVVGLGLRWVTTKMKGRGGLGHVADLKSRITNLKGEQ